MTRTYRVTWSTTFTVSARSGHRKLAWQIAREVRSIIATRWFLLSPTSRLIETRVEEVAGEKP